MCEAHGKLGPSYLELEQALARSESARREAEERASALAEEIARHPRRCTAENKCEPCRSEERAWAQTEATEEALASERAAREAAERMVETWHVRAEAHRIAADLAEARVAELEQHRTQLDCRFAGRYAEMSGSHCPSGEPCQRCELERAREAAERERESQRSDAAKFHGMLLAAESSLSRAVEALRRIVAARCTCNVSYLSGIPIHNQDCESTRTTMRSIARAVLAEVGK